MKSLVLGIAIFITGCAVEDEDQEDPITRVTGSADLAGLWTTGCYNAGTRAPNAELPYALKSYEFSQTEFVATFSEFSSPSCSSEQGTSLLGEGSGTFTLGSQTTLSDGSEAIEIDLTYTDETSNSSTDFELLARDGNRLFFGLELPDPAQRPATVDKGLPFHGP